MTIPASRFLNELWLQRTVKEFVTACIRSITDYAIPLGETGRSDYDAKRHVQHWDLRILTLEEHHNQLCNTLFSNILSDPIHKIRNQLLAPSKVTIEVNSDFFCGFLKKVFFFRQEKTNRARNSINAMVSDNNFCEFLCFRKFRTYSWNIQSYGQYRKNLDLLEPGPRGIRSSIVCARKYERIRMT